MKKREPILFIESCFRNIQHERDIESNVKLIERTIKREYGISVDITIIDNGKNFFGMCIFPSPEEMSALTKALINTEAGSMKDVEKLHQQYMVHGDKIIEIDSRLLYDSEINATPAEITAVLLHEIGHIVASNSMINKLKRAKEYMLSKFDNKTLHLLPKIPLKEYLFSIATLQIFGQRFNVQLIKEKEADELALKEGYGEDLVNLLNKLIANGHGEQVKKSKRDQEKDIEVTIDWLIVNIKELEYRKNRLKKSLTILKLTTPSLYVADRVSEVLDKMYKKDRKAYEEVLLNESFIIGSLKNKRLKAPSGAMDRGRVAKLQARDLNIYRAELERVNTVDDKIFLLERLHDLLDVAEYAKYMCQEDPKRVMQSEQTIDNYIKELNDLIRMTSEKPIGKEKYGLFIKYPADYEG